MRRMPIMTHRKTFIVDEATANRIKRLEVLWQVTQTEVLRRALALAEDASTPNESTAPPLRADLEAGYRAMAADETREAEALEWSERLSGDTPADMPE